VPVREIAVGGDLERAEDADVEVPAAHHRERIAVMEEGAAGEQRDRLLPGVDEVPVHVLLGRRRPHAEEPVLALEEDLPVLGQEVRNAGRQADAEVDVRALGNVARDARRHLVTVESVHGSLREIRPPPSPSRRSARLSARRCRA
jgi:hypothetical protein